MRRRNALIAILAFCLIAPLQACKPIQADLTPTPIREEESKQVNAISSANLGQITLLKTFAGHQGRVLDVVFSPDGELLASSGRDRKIRLWQTSTGEELISFQMHSVDLADIDISPDGRLLASGEAIWDLKEMQEIQILERGTIHPTSVAFSPDGTLLAVARFDQGVEIWNPDSGEIIQSFEVGPDTRTKGMEFSPDGRLLAAGVIDGTIRIWEIRSGEITDTLHYPGETDIHDLAYSADGRYLGAVGRLPRVMLWDTFSRETISLPSFRDNANAVDFSPDSSLLAVSAGAERSVFLYDLSSDSLSQTLPLSEQSLAMRFSPDGSYLATGLFDGQILLWGISTGQR